MNTASFLGSMIGGAMRAGGKRHRRARHFMRGGSHAFLNTSTLLTLAGLAWGAFESIRSPASSGSPSDPSGDAPRDASGDTPRDPSGDASARRAGATVPPPLPGAAAAVPSASGVARIAALAISAARADGELVGKESEAILAAAREHGVESAVAAELERSRPLAEIVGGITDPAMRRDLYVLAFTIVRADETVKGAERVYLAQLAHRLALDPATVAGLEAETSAKIDQQRVE